MIISRIVSLSRKKPIPRYLTDRLGAPGSYLFCYLFVVQNKKSYENFEYQLLGNTLFLKTFHKMKYFNWVHFDTSYLRVMTISKYDTFGNVKNY